MLYNLPITIESFTISLWKLKASSDPSILDTFYDEVVSSTNELNEVDKNEGFFFRAASIYLLSSMRDVRLLIAIM
jgi:hypothetical protein